MCLRWGAEEWGGDLVSGLRPGSVSSDALDPECRQINGKRLLFPQRSRISRFCFPIHFAFINHVIQREHTQDENPETLSIYHTLSMFVFILNIWNPESKMSEWKKFEGCGQITDSALTKETGEISSMGGCDDQDRTSLPLCTTSPTRFLKIGFSDGGSTLMLQASSAQAFSDVMLHTPHKPIPPTW